MGSSVVKLKFRRDDVGHFEVALRERMARVDEQVTASVIETLVERGGGINANDAVGLGQLSQTRIVAIIKPAN